MSDSLTHIHVPKFEILVRMEMKIQIFSDVTPCAPVNSNISKKLDAFTFRIVPEGLNSNINVILNGLLKDIMYLPGGTRWSVSKKISSILTKFCNRALLSKKKRFPQPHHTV
jgi:hypothetical protein